LPSTTSRRTAPGPRTPRAASTYSLRQLLLVVLDPTRSHVVQVAAEDLLVVEREAVDDARLQHRLRRLEGVGVLESVLLERHRRDLLCDALTRVLRGHEVQRPLEQVRVVGRRPV